MTTNILSLPPEIRQRIFAELKEPGGITNIESVATTCREFFADIKDMSFQLGEIRTLYKHPDNAPLSPDKIRINGMRGYGDFHKSAPIAHVAKILGGNQSSASVSEECAQISSHVLPLFVWAPVDPEDPIGSRDIICNGFKRIEISGRLWEMVHFNGDQDQRPLEAFGLRPGHCYQYNYRLM